MEITAEVADSDRCTAVEQVTNGVSIRMAVLYLLLGGNRTRRHRPTSAVPRRTQARAMSKILFAARGCSAASRRTC